MRRFVAIATMVGIAATGVVGIVGCNSNTAAESKMQESTRAVIPETEPNERGNTGGGMAAVEKAAQAKKYLFALFWKEEDDQAGAMRRVLQEVMQKVADRADAVEVSISDPSERAIVDQFGLTRAPMPLVLVLAPNGAITGGFPTKVEARQLLDAFASPCTEKCMKRLQENKLVFLCVQNATTQSNDAALEGVRQLQSDSRFAKATETVILDPTDAAEAAFLKDLQIDPKTKQAVTVFLAPPGAPIAIFEGATSKEALVAALEKASSGCCPGGSCGPGGCAPK